MSLGSWAAIDIETTGIDPAHDQIIDVGYLLFEGTELIEKYSSLVRYEGHLSHFIQKLTGITESMVRKAPQWLDVENKISELDNINLIAHNADFEKNFLGSLYSSDTSFQDSMLFLSLIFPGRSSLNLESFIIDFGIADHEVHRGYEDSLDLIKVMLCAAFLKETRVEYKVRYQQTQMFLRRYPLENFWFLKFWDLDQSELNHIADQIDFDLKKHIEYFLNDDDKAEMEGDVPPLEDLAFSRENINKVLGDEERIQSFLPHYSYRESQEILSCKVGQSFKNSVHAMIQAPTGTGKTIGYMLPSALFALNDKKQILVATGTKTLQEQAMKKDVPLLKKILGTDELRVSRLIGSQNHLCELMFRKGEGELDLFDESNFIKNFSQLYFELLFLVNTSESQGKTRLDIPHALKRKFEEFEKLDKESAVDFRTCSGSRCPYKKGCTYINDIREAKDAHIIIGNHALMFSWPKGFPRPLHVVVDEAHRIEGDATSAFSATVTDRDLVSLSKSLQNMQGIGALFYLLALEDEGDDVTEKINEIKEQVKMTSQLLNEHLLPLRDKVEIFFKQKPRYTSEFWNELPMINSKTHKEALAVGILKHVESLKFVIESLLKLLAPFDGLWEASNLKDDNAITAHTKFTSFYQHLVDIYDVFSIVLEGKEEFAHAMKYHEKFGFEFESKVIDVGKKVYENLLSTSESVVFTSATLSNESGDMAQQGVEWPLGYLYLEPSKRYRKGFFLPGVYDYETNAKVYICDDTPSFYEQDFVPSTLEKIIPLIRNIGGRSLLLFSARKRFEIAREVLLEKLAGDIPVFIQGMGNQVVEEYKRSPNGILLGMEAFGEGIDIPGDALKFVFIDKVPDLRHDLVIQKRRDFFERTFSNEFQDYFMANRARGLSQKLGRLLRTEQDHGGVIIVDSRLRKWKGRTFDQFVRLLKPYKIQRKNLSDACEELNEFLTDS